MKTPSVNVKAFENFALHCTRTNPQESSAIGVASSGFSSSSSFGASAVGLSSSIAGSNRKASNGSGSSSSIPAARRDQQVQARRAVGVGVSPAEEFIEGALTLASSTGSSGVVSVTISTPEGRPCKAPAT